MYLYLIFQIVSASYNPDKVDISKISQLPQNYTHNWYSGYLAGSIPTKSLYYNFFYSQNDPLKDPVILWLQGGPGCSSLFGLYYENGPFQFYPTEAKSFINPYAWNLNASLLYVESPPGVGFSETDNMSADDNSTTDDNYAALIDFFYNKFPEFQKLPFYIASESYGGIYVPYLSSKIVEMNKLKKQIINLKGFLVGNACTRNDECTDQDQIPLGFSRYQFEQLFDHAFYSNELRNQYKVLCDGENFISSDCLLLQKILMKYVDHHYVDIDNINGECYHSPAFEKYAINSMKHKYLTNLQQSTYMSRKKLHIRQKGSKNPGACDYEVGDIVILNNQTVREALHIKQNVNDLFWETCTNQEFIYTEFPQGSQFLYSQLIEANLKIWVFSGDVDANVPITGTLFWIEELVDQLKLKEIEPWRAWFINGDREDEMQVGGFTWGLEGLRFTSVRGAGHEVPFWKPYSAYVLFNSFLFNETLPKNPRKQLYD